jgi:hypothetical protein
VRDNRLNSAESYRPENRGGSCDPCSELFAMRNRRNPRVDAVHLTADEQDKFTYAKSG